MKYKLGYIDTQYIIFNHKTPKYLSIAVKNNEYNTLNDLFYEITEKKINGTKKIKQIIVTDRNAITYNYNITNDDYINDNYWDTIIKPIDYENGYQIFMIFNSELSDPITLEIKGNKIVFIEYSFTKGFNTKSWIFTDINENNVELFLEKENNNGIIYNDLISIEGIFFGNDVSLLQKKNFENNSGNIKYIGNGIPKFYKKDDEIIDYNGFKFSSKKFFTVNISENIIINFNFNNYMNIYNLTSDIVIYNLNDFIIDNYYNCNIIYSNLSIKPNPALILHNNENSYDIIDSNLIIRPEYRGISYTIDIQIYLDIDSSYSLNLKYNIHEENSNLIPDINLYGDSNINLIINNNCNLNLNEYYDFKYNEYLTFSNNYYDNVSIDNNIIIINYIEFIYDFEYIINITASFFNKINNRLNLNIKNNALIFYDHRKLSYITLNSNIDITYRNFIFNLECNIIINDNGKRIGLNISDYIILDIAYNNDYILSNNILTFNETYTKYNYNIILNILNNDYNLNIHDTRYNNALLLIHQQYNSNLFIVNNTINLLDNEILSNLGLTINDLNLRPDEYAINNNELELENEFILIPFSRININIGLFNCNLDFIYYLIDNRYNLLLDIFIDKNIDINSNINLYNLYNIDDYYKDIVKFEIDDYSNLYNFNSNLGIINFNSNFYDNYDLSLTINININDLSKNININITDDRYVLAFNYIDLIIINLDKNSINVLEILSNEFIKNEKLNDIDLIDFKSNISLIPNTSDYYIYNDYIINFYEIYNNNNNNINFNISSIRNNINNFRLLEIIDKRYWYSETFLKTIYSNIIITDPFNDSIDVKNLLDLIEPNKVIYIDILNSNFYNYSNNIINFNLDTEYDYYNISELKEINLKIYYENYEKYSNIITIKYLDNREKYSEIYLSNIIFDSNYIIINNNLDLLTLLESEENYFRNNLILSNITVDDNKYIIDNSNLIFENYNYEYVINFTLYLFKYEKNYTLNINDQRYVLALNSLNFDSNIYLENENEEVNIYDRFDLSNFGLTNSLIIISNIDSDNTNKYNIIYNSNLEFHTYYYEYNITFYLNLISESREYSLNINDRRFEFALNSLNLDSNIYLNEINETINIYDILNLSNLGLTNSLVIISNIDLDNTKYRIDDSNLIFENFYYEYNISFDLLLFNQSKNYNLNIYDSRYDIILENISDTCNFTITNNFSNLDLYDIFNIGILESINGLPNNFIIFSNIIDNEYFSNINNRNILFNRIYYIYEYNIDFIIKIDNKSKNIRFNITDIRYNIILDSLSNIYNINLNEDIDLFIFYEILNIREDILNKILLKNSNLISVSNIKLDNNYHNEYNTESILNHNIEFLENYYIYNYDINYVFKIGNEIKDIYLNITDNRYNLININYNSNIEITNEKNIINLFNVFSNLNNEYEIPNNLISFSNIEFNENYCLIINDSNIEFNNNYLYNHYITLNLIIENIFFNKNINIIDTRYNLININYNSNIEITNEKNIINLFDVFSNLKNKYNIPNSLISFRNKSYNIYYEYNNSSNIIFNTNYYYEYTIIFDIIIDDYIGNSNKILNISDTRYDLIDLEFENVYITEDISYINIYDKLNFRNFGLSKNNLIISNIESNNKYTINNSNIYFNRTEYLYNYEIKINLKFNRLFEEKLNIFDIRLSVLLSNLLFDSNIILNKNEEINFYERFNLDNLGLSENEIKLSNINENEKYNIINNSNILFTNKYLYNYKINFDLIFENNIKNYNLNIIDERWEIAMSNIILLNSNINIRKSKFNKNIYNLLNLKELGLDSNLFYINNFNPNNDEIENNNNIIEFNFNEYNLTNSNEINFKLYISNDILIDKDFKLNIIDKRLILIENELILRTSNIKINLDLLENYYYREKSLLLFSNIIINNKNYNIETNIINSNLIINTYNRNISYEINIIAYDNINNIKNSDLNIKVFEINNNLNDYERNNYNLEEFIYDSNIINIYKLDESYNFYKTWYSGNSEDSKTLRIISERFNNDMNKGIKLPTIEFINKNIILEDIGVFIKTKKDERISCIGVIEDNGITKLIKNVDFNNNNNLSEYIPKYNGLHDIEVKMHENLINSEFINGYLYGSNIDIYILINNSNLCLIDNDIISGYYIIKCDIEIYENNYNIYNENEINYYNINLKDLFDNNDIIRLEENYSNESHKIRINISNINDEMSFDIYKIKEINEINNNIIRLNDNELLSINEIIEINSNIIIELEDNKINNIVYCYNLERSNIELKENILLFDKKLDISKNIELYDIENLYFNSEYIYSILIKNIITGKTLSIEKSIITEFGKAENFRYFNNKLKHEIDFYWEDNVRTGNKNIKPNDLYKIEYNSSNIYITSNIKYNHNIYDNYDNRIDQLFSYGSSNIYKLITNNNEITYKEVIYEKYHLEEDSINFNLLESNSIIECIINDYKFKDGMSANYIYIYSNVEEKIINKDDDILDNFEIIDNYNNNGIILNKINDSNLIIKIENSKINGYFINFLLIYENIEKRIRKYSNYELTYSKSINSDLNKDIELLNDIMVIL